MNYMKIVENIKKTNLKKEHFEINGKDFLVYPKSLKEKNGISFFAGKHNYSNIILACGENGSDELKCFDYSKNDHDRSFVEIPFSTKNVKCFQELFPELKPVTLGVCNSFGFGDRIGLANPGHIQACRESKFKPILAQQSIRELTRTNRTPDEVMNAAVWAAFQEGWVEGFGADADHLKTFEDIDLMVGAGYTMFTFDPNNYVFNEADSLSENELQSKLNDINWNDLDTTPEKMIADYKSNSYLIGDDFSIAPNEIEILRGIAKYGNAVAHIKRLYNYLRNTYPDYKSEVEISVDETDSVTTPFEHFFISNELSRLNVKIESLAPRFVGEFEKGIEYKGDLDVFKNEYKKHLLITKYFGSYKLSIHSGSDKFKAYAVIGSFNEAFTHVKTAGTSYLEALRVAAAKNKPLFREILDYSRGLFDEAKQTYHVSAKSGLTNPADSYSDDELEKLMDDENTRQILHVAFGQILTDKYENGEYKFKDRLLNCLNKYEDIYDGFLKRHFENHIRPFEKMN